MTEVGTLAHNKVFDMYQIPHYMSQDIPINTFLKPHYTTSPGLSSLKTDQLFIFSPCFVCFRALIKDNQSDLTTNNSWIFVNSAINVCVNNPQNGKKLKTKQLVKACLNLYTKQQQTNKTTK